MFALAAIDGRVREHASTLVSDGLPIGSVSNVGGRAGGLVMTAGHFARSWSGEHLYLTIFAVAGVVLLAAVRRL